MSRYVMGVYSGHDAAACLFKDNKLQYAIEKERLSRIKHDEGEPIECIEYILKAANLNYFDIDLVVRCNWFDTKFRNDEYYQRFPLVIDNPNHHLFHSYAVSLVNQNTDMMILVYDGRGCRPQDSKIGIPYSENVFESESLYFYHNRICIPIEKRFSTHEKNRYKWGSFLESLGYLYAAVSKAIFSDSHAAGKVMALASLGVDSKIPEPLRDDYSINRDFLDYINNLSLPIDWNTEIAKNLSFKIQRSLERYIKHRIEIIANKYGINDFALSGGVALNCKNNGLIGNLDCVNSLSLFPACGDDGIAVGAAVWAIREYFKDNSDIEWQVFTGRKYNELSYESNQLCSIVNSLINGKFIGFFEGASEFGPRALCHRSIICSADSIDMKNKLNNEIKHREPFRPFGGVILARNVCKISNEKIVNPYMLSAVHIREEYKQKIPALIHCDGTVRLQIIEDESSFIGRILATYEERTGHHVLINTSFNAKGEPIVESVEDAIMCAKKLGLSMLCIDGVVQNV